MSIPTVRVKHPSGDGFMTINAADFEPGLHELHGEQAEGFDPAHLRHTVEALDPVVRDAAAALCMRMVALRRRVTGEPFADLSGEEKLAVLRAMDAEMTTAEAAYDDDQRERAAFEAGERERIAREASQEARDGDMPSAAPPGPPEPSSPAAEPLRVGKGPRGLWFVFRGEERVSKGYPDQAGAEGEAQRLIQAEHAAAQDAAR